MIKYETLIVLSCKMEDEAQKELIAKLRSLIESNGTIESFDEWGKRRLAYPINYENDGYYILCIFESGPDFPKELERVYHISDGVLRTMTIKKEG